MRKSQLAIAVAVALSLPTVGYAAGDVVIEQGGSDDHEANVVRNGTNPTSKVKIMQWDAAPQTANVERGERSYNRFVWVWSNLCGKHLQYYAG